MSFVQIDTTLSYVYFVKKNWSKICHRSMLVIGALFYVFESFSVLIPAIFRRHWGLFLLICYKNFVIDRISDAHLKLNAIIYMMEPDFNSLRPGDTCMWKWTMSSLVQVKTCHLFDTKQSRWVTDDFLSISTTWNKHQWNFNQNRKKIFFQKNVFANGICKMSAILFQPRCVTDVKQCADIFQCHNFHVSRRFCAIICKLKPAREICTLNFILTESVCFIQDLSLSNLIYQLVCAEESRTGVM